MWIRTFITTLVGTGLATAQAGIDLHAGPTASAPLTPSVFWVDFDADGHPDAFAVSPGGEARLFRNIGAGSFEDVTGPAGLAGAASVHTALFGDYDADGKLDLFLASYSGPSRLFRQAEGGTFVDETAAAGLTGDEGVLAAEWIDFDADGLIDLHLSTVTSDVLYQNVGAAFRGVALDLDRSAPFTTLGESGRLPRRAPDDSGTGGPIVEGTGGGTTITPGGPSDGTSPLVVCASAIDDLGNPGVCLNASSVPALGMLYPLSEDLFVDSIGYVGVGTSTPGARLDVDGTFRASDTIVSTKVSGAPFSVASSDLSPNLNADLLDGFHAANFSQLGSSIGNGELENDSVTTFKILDGTILGIDIGVGQITNSRIAADAINASNIVDNAIGTNHIATGNVTADDIAANAVGSSEIAAGAVGTAELVDSSVTNAKLAADAVTSAEILDGSITAADLAAGVGSPGPDSVGSAEVVNNSLTASDLATSSVGTSEVADNSLTASDLATNSVGASEIATGAVGTSEVSDNSLTASDLATNSVGASEIATGAVGTSEVSDNSLTASDLATNSVGASEIATGAVGTSEVADNSLTANDLASNSVGASEIATGAVGTSEVADNSLTASDLASNSVASAEIVNGSVDYFDLASPLDGSTSGSILYVQNDTTLTQGKAIQAETSASGGVALEALALNTGSGVTYGVKGLSSSAFGYGVWGRANGNSSNFGVFGETFSGSGTGVHGTVSATSGSFTYAVRGVNDVTSGTNYGLRGESASSSGRGVYGYVSNTSGTSYGVRGDSASATGYGISAIGDLIATGTKSFVQPHPLDASKQIRFVCLEGNESGTYFRGSSRVVAGSAVIEVPEEFRHVSEEDGLTVQLTALGPNAGLWVESKGLGEIVVRGAQDVEFDYFVNGVRLGFADIDLVRANSEFVPAVKGVPFGTQYPSALRDVLVGNGILNADYTPNEGTAAAMGWELVEPDSADALGRER